MSDPTNDRFRDLATLVAPAVLAPEFDDLQRTARRRRTRRTSVTVVTVLTGVVLAVTAPGIAGFRASDPASRVTGAPTDEMADLRTSGHGIVFFTRALGYRDGYRCPARQVPCELKVEATVDGGRTWQARPLPPLPRPTASGSNDPTILYVSPQHIALEMGDERQVSTDGGFHWAPAPPPAEDPPVAAVSGSNDVFADCPQHGICSRPRLATRDPETGAVAPLRTQPTLSSLDQRPETATDGSIWVPGRDASGRPAVSSSHDGGRSWVTRPLQGITRFSESTLLVLPVDGQRAYALDTAAAGTPGKLPIVRTDDGGQTWRLLPEGRGLLTEGRASLDPDVAQEAVILPDGRLAISQRQPHPGLVASSDGITFQRIPRVPGLFSFQSFPGGVLGVADPVGPKLPSGGAVQGRGMQAWMTTDGSNWRPLPWWDPEG